MTTKVRRNFATLTRINLTLATGVMGCCLTASAQTQAPCPAVAPGTTLQESAGCFPLLWKPADGGPVQAVLTPAVFVGPVQNATPATVAAKKFHELEIGANAFYANPDYGHGSNVDVGAFVAYTGRYIGAEVSAADTVEAKSGIHEPYIVGGPRFQYATHYFDVYVKAQAGVGHFSGDNAQPENNKQTFLVENYGAGLEFKVSRHMKVRAIDANYQIWPSFHSDGLTPIRLGSGIVFTL